MSLSGTVIYFGGWGDKGRVSSFSEEQWTDIGTLRHRRDSHTAIAIGNSVFIMGGTL